MGKPCTIATLREVLARRGALRWFLEEIGRCKSDNTFQSEWVSDCEDGKYSLNSGVELILYVSTVPCGDASMRFLSASQDEQMAALKDSAVRPPTDTTLAARGRDNYALWGVLRTKPGRADAPSTASMSCSDKIAAWNFLGIQGALGSRFLGPLYIHHIIIGEVPAALHGVVREDCERALWRRLEGVPACGQFELHRPAIYFTDVPFIHSRTSTPQAGGSCNDSLWWIADSGKAQVIINGYKRGVAPKDRHLQRFRPQASRKSMLHLYCQTLDLCGLTSETDSKSYREVKQSLVEFKAAKQALMGETGVFSGWVRGSSTRFEATTVSATTT